MLSRIGYYLHVYDMDILDETNMGGQLYPVTGIGVNKAQALKDNIAQFSGHGKIDTYDRYTEKDGMATPIMFSAFDNMGARKVMFENWAKQKDRGIFIDGRMLAESFQIFAVLPGSEDRYREELFEDEEIQDQPCSAKATSHCGAMISSMMVGILTNYMSNIQMKMDIREVPFKTTFEIPLLTYNIERYV